MEQSELLKELHVLYVEDDEFARQGISRLLQRWVKKLHVAVNGLEALEMFKQLQPDIIITDIKMPVMSGLELAQEIRAVNTSVPIVITSAHSESEYLLRSIELGIDGYMLKPVVKESLKTLLLKHAKIIYNEREVAKLQLLMQELFEIQDNMLLLYDSTGAMVQANESFLNFFQCSSLSDFKVRFNDVSETFLKNEGYYYRQLKSTASLAWFMEYDILDLERKVVQMAHGESVNTFALHVKKFTKLEYWVCSFNDITYLENRKNQLKQQAMHDALTGIYNRYTFDENLKHMTEEFSYNGQPLSLVMIDIDHFKEVNDTFGHQVGDEVLKELAVLISETIRSSDMFARWGGEEFVILFPYSNAEHACEKCELLRQKVEHYRFAHNKTLTVSMGVTEYKFGQNIEEFSSKADQALYNAKANGRNRVEVI